MDDHNDNAWNELDERNVDLKWAFVNQFEREEKQKTSDLYLALHYTEWITKLIKHAAYSFTIAMIIVGCLVILVYIWFVDKKWYEAQLNTSASLLL